MPLYPILYVAIRGTHAAYPVSSPMVAGWWSLLHDRARPPPAPRHLRAHPQPDEVMVDADPNVHQALEVLKDLQREGGLARRLDRPRTRRLANIFLNPSTRD